MNDDRDSDPGREDTPLDDIVGGGADGRSRDDLFREQFPGSGIADVDVDELWKELEDGATVPDDWVESLQASSNDQFGTTEHLVSKREFCHRCPYFSAPPTVACEHEGTEILELVGEEMFRVRNCPMVIDDETSTGIRNRLTRLGKAGSKE